MNWVAWFMLTEKIRNTWPPPGLSLWLPMLLRAAWGPAEWHWMRSRAWVRATSFLFTARSSWARPRHALLPVFSWKVEIYSKCPSYLRRGQKEPSMAHLWTSPSPTWPFLHLKSWVDASSSGKSILTCQGETVASAHTCCNLFTLLFLQLACKSYSSFLPSGA